MVRGATGLLNGAGEPSAAINLIRKHANSKQFAGSVSVDVGRWNRKELTADVSMPLNPGGTVRARVVASGSREDSYIDWQETENRVFYAVMDADLGAATHLSLGISHQAEDREDALWSPLPIWYADGSRTDWDRSKNTASDWSEWLTQEDTAFLALEHRFGSDWSLRVNASHHKNIDDEKQLWWDGLPERDTGLGNTLAGYYWTNTSVQDQAGAVLSGLFTGFGREHEVSIGLLYSDFETRWHDIRDDPNAYVTEADFNHWRGDGYPEPEWGATYLGAKDITRQSAAYAVARFALADDLKLITGARLSNWHWRTEQAEWTPESYTVEEDGILTPYAGVIYDLTDWLSAYGSYTSIFKPQTNRRDRYGKYLDPLEGKSYELGLKGEWLDGNLNGSAAVFKTDQDNFAIADEGHIVPNTVDTQAYYAGQGVKVEGYELELTGDVRANWNISASWTHYSAKDAEDEEVAVDHPRRLLKLYTQYGFTGDWRGLRAGGGVNWQSRQPRRTPNPVTGELEAVGEAAYGLVDVMAGYALAQQLDLQLNVTNLFDKRYRATSFWDAYTWGEPRSYSLSLRYDF